MARKLIHTAGKVTRPEGAGVLTTYDELRAKAAAFAAGKYILLTICGGSGIGKSTIMKKALEGQEYGLVKANAAPFGLYCMGWTFRNKPLLIDDADQLNKSEQGKRLLKSMCDTEAWRFITWQTSTLLNKKNAPAPAHYYTNSKICVLTNEWYIKNGDVHSEAVGDRGMTYLFHPTALEIHRYTATWFWDQQIFDAVARHLPYICNHSCRLYFRAWQEKNAGGNWMDVILNQIYGPDDMEYKVLALMEGAHKDDTKTMCEEFIANGYGSRATFYRYYADLKERHKLQTVEYIAVQGKPPEEGPDPMANGDGNSDVDDEADEDDDQDEVDSEANGESTAAQADPPKAKTPTQRGRKPQAQAAKATPKKRGRKPKVAENGAADSTAKGNGREPKGRPASPKASTSKKQVKKRKAE